MDDRENDPNSWVLFGARLLRPVPFIYHCESSAIYYLACINKRVDNIITTLVSCLNVGWRQLMNRLMQILVTLDDSEAVLLWNSAVHTQILTVNEVTVFATEGNAQGRTRTLSIEH